MKKKAASKKTTEKYPEHPLSKMFLHTFKEDGMREFQGQIVGVDGEVVLVPFEMKDLKRGDIVQHQGSGRSYVVTDHDNFGAVIVRTERLTNPEEWLVLRTNSVDTPRKRDELLKMIHEYNRSCTVEAAEIRLL